MLTSRPTLLTTSSRFLPRAVMLLGLLAFAPAAGVGQRVSVGDPLDGYLRVMQLAGTGNLGSFTVRPLVTPLAANAGADPWNAIGRLGERIDLGGGVWVGAVQAAVHGYLNTAFPWVENDGAVWQGKGVTGAVQAGGTMGSGPLTVTLLPIFSYAQNSDFDLARSERPGEAAYRYPWSEGIDAPQRFGPDALSTFDLGQSSIRLAMRGVSAGVGTENLWWGPGSRNSLIMSNNAAGFPHADISTNGAVDIGIGTLEAQWVWGRLSHSEWWDESLTDRNRFFTGAVVAYSPKWAQGFTAGATRAFHRLLPTGGLNAKEYFLVLQGVEKREFVTADNYQGDDIHDQMASVFARWVFPESGAEVYGEYGRNDHGWDFRDYFLEPEHSRAFLWGFRKASIIGGERLLSISGEVTHLAKSQTQQVRASPTWYAHHRSLQGYTHKGQILGAGLGPGGNGAYLGVDLYHPGGSLGAFVRRRVHDNDAYYEQAEFGDFDRHHVSLDLGGQAVILRDGIEINVAGAITRDFNRYFILRNDLWNAHLEFSARWRMK